MRRSILILCLLAGVARAHPRDYVGPGACGACHAETLAQWKSTAHARAAADLGAQAKNGACLTCHGTGDGVSARTLTPGVGCEACHGGGAAYAAFEDVMRDPPLARLLGLRADPKATCLRCHRVTTSLRGFDADAAWARIAHGRTP